MTQVSISGVQAQLMAANTSYNDFPRVLFLGRRGGGEHFPGVHVEPGQQGKRAVADAQE